MHCGHWHRQVSLPQTLGQQVSLPEAFDQIVIIDANGTYKNCGKFIDLQPEHRSCSSGIEVARQETMRIEVRHLLEVDGRQQDKPTSGVPVRAGLAG